MRNPENIRQLATLDINWIGFIFYKKSLRYFDLPIPPQEKNNSPLTINHSPLKRVGVFVNASVEEMMEKAGQYKLDYLQLHGNEPADVCHTLHKRGYALIKAFPIETKEDLSKTLVYEDRVDYFLFDTKCNEYGGSGKLFDWSVLSAYKGNTPFLLSGGINPGCIREILQFQHPFFAGIDLNSGFEITPGLKDIGKLHDFIKEIRKTN
jgi:phosphoribosylanthranilate isomerase